ncbi:MAG: acyl-homoserine-lactone acylase [Pseudoalteromonas tetraodonis]|jgi:acyl-homoserine-lactone acylase
MPNTLLRLCAVLLLLSGCAQHSAPTSTPSHALEVTQPNDNIDVNIRWTSYGIPHVNANNWTSLGYGYAYATATDGVCVIARDIVTVNGNSMKYFGDEQRASDVFHRAVVSDSLIEQYNASQSARAKRFNAGYVAGYNRYLADHAGALPASCANAEWVRPIAINDMARLVVGVGIRYGLGRYTKDIATAQPPVQAAEDAVTLPNKTPLTPEAEDQPLASNAVAFGRAVTQNGRGILFGNPHYPWSGPSRFHLIHMTLPGQVDIMGTSLLSTAGVSIGFNHDVAWTHTVSTGMRATLYKLELHPDDPTEYRFEDGYRKMEARAVTLADGVTTKVYFSHYGPIVVREGLVWDQTTAYTVRDANLGNFQTAASYHAMSQASDVHELIEAISLGGVSWVNTIASDSKGNAMYADISTVPNVDAELIEQCQVAEQQVGRSKMLVLDGSRADCAWRDSSEAPVANTMPASKMPRLVRDDYVSNSNDSYWLSNPKAPLEGYSPIIGSERTARSLRTRAGLHYVDELLQAGPVKPSAVYSLIDDHRNFGAELLLDDLLRLCIPKNSTIAASCVALKQWDRAHRVDSRGAHLWTEIMRSLRAEPSIYKVPFDPNDPTNTPSGLNNSDPQISELLIAAIETAQQRLTKLHIALDAKLGDIQYVQRNERKIAIPGGEGWSGAFSMIIAPLAEKQGVGYTPVVHGNSIIEVVSWDDQGKVNPRGILTYSQSQEPDSPHYADQTELYSKGLWIDFPFHEEDIANNPDLHSLRLTE